MAGKGRIKPMCRSGNYQSPGLCLCGGKVGCFFSLGGFTCRLRSSSPSSRFGFGPGLISVNMTYSCNDWISELKVAYRHLIGELNVAVSKNSALNLLIGSMAETRKETLGV